MIALSLENPAYLEKTKAMWRGYLPKGMHVVEFYGDSKPFTPRYGAGLSRAGLRWSAAESQILPIG